MRRPNIGISHWGFSFELPAATHGRERELWSYGMPECFQNTPAEGGVLLEFFQNRKQQIVASNFGRITAMATMATPREPL